MQESVPTKEQEIFYGKMEKVKEIIKYFSAKLEHRFLSNADFYQLFSLSRQVSAGGRVVEIGAGAGCSIITMGIGSQAMNKNIELITIDPFVWTRQLPPHTIYKELGRDVKKEDILARFRENIAHWGLEVILLQETSVSGCRKIGDESVDLLFIDGNHQYHAVKWDILNYRPKVKKGGIFCDHDYQKCHPGVRKVVDEAFDENIFRVLGASSIWVEK